MDVEKDVWRLHMVLAIVGQASGMSFANIYRESIMEALSQSKEDGNSLACRMASWLVDRTIADANKAGVYIAPFK